MTLECKLYRICQSIAKLAGISWSGKAPEIEITHHPITDGGEIRIAINYADYAVDGMGSGKVRIETVRTGKMGRL